MGWSSIRILVIKRESNVKVPIYIYKNKNSQLNHVIILT